MHHIPGVNRIAHKIKIYSNVYSARAAAGLFLRNALCGNIPQLRPSDP